MNESEINKLINSMTNKFKNGGFIDCLRDGGSIEKCKCGCDKIAKARGGLKTRVYQYTLPNKNEYTMVEPGTSRTTTERMTVPSNGNVFTRTITPKPGSFQRDTLVTMNGEQIGNDERRFKLLNEYFDEAKTGAYEQKFDPSTVQHMKNVGMFDDGGVVDQQLPRYGKIVEQGWNAPRYTFLHNVNPITVKNAPLNTVTPSNIDDGSYEGMWYAEEQVANPWDEWTNKINKTAGLPAFPRLYKSPDFRHMVNHPTEAGVVSIREDAPVDRKKATKELAEKQATIRTQKKACGGPLPKKSKFKK